MRKKKVLYWSNGSTDKTGFGRNTKEILTYLHSTGKYDIVEYCSMKNWSNDISHSQKPWPSFGTIPDNPQEVQLLTGNDDQKKRMMAYGANNLDKIVYQEKPDIIFAVEDIWGIDYSSDKIWFDKITTVLWTTLDSLPILKSGVDIAPRAKNYWVWSNFAEKALHKLGNTHIKTVHGAIDCSKFFRLPDKEKLQLRKNNNISENSFIIGFVFRNQPRKSVPNLLEGFKLFKQQNPEIKNPKLFLHTCWREGWDIKGFAKQYNISENDILTTYICQNCHSYKVQEHTGEGIKCPVCNHEKSFVTTHPSLGISEEQLNEIYNLMDVYCHPFTSGGQEIPIQEAKLTELITLVTNYSCGEELCEPEAQSLPLEWAMYRGPEEAQSLFVKASTYPSSISKQLTKVANMDKNKKEEMGKKARKWVIDNFSREVIGKKIEDFIDNSPFTEYDFKQIQENPNPLTQFTPEKDNELWIIQLYKEILGREVTKYDSGVRHWLNQLKVGLGRPQIEQQFRQIAQNTLLQKQKQNLFNKLAEDKNKKLLYVIPASERDIFLSTSLFRSIKELYPEYKLYIAIDLKYRDILNGNLYIDEIISYYSEMDNFQFLEGSGAHNGYFDFAFLPYLSTQRLINYTHGGKDIIAFKDYKY